MKAGIHPQYFTDAQIKCANCGHTFTTGATQKEMQVEICSQCHPFFTGKKVLIDTEGRVDKFEKKMAAAMEAGQKKKIRKKKTLEEKVNEELAAQLGVQKKKEAKKAAAQPKKAEVKTEETPETPTQDVASEE